MSSRADAAIAPTEPPPLALATYASLDQERNVVRANVHQLCLAIAEEDAGVEAVLRRTVDGLLAHLRHDASVLTGLAFPVMEERYQWQCSMTGSAQDLERAFRRGVAMETLFDTAHELRRAVLSYFDWLDGMFCRGPRGYG